jgi:hypothetical protein
MRRFDKYDMWVFNTSSIVDVIQGSDSWESFQFYLFHNDLF